MKKIFVGLIAIFLIASFSCVFADMGAPEIKSYRATPKNIEGAKYYKYTYDPSSESAQLVEIGVLEYGEIVEVYYESIENGIRYGSFSYDDGNYEAKLEDLTAVIEDDNKYEVYPVSRNMKVLANDIFIYSGPAYVYDVIGTIPMKTDIVVNRIAHINANDGKAYEEDMNPWLYVEYNGISGWVCELHGAIGQYYDEELILLVDMVVSDDEIAIPANTIIKGYYESDMWTSKALVNYNGEDYLIPLYDCALESSYIDELKIDYYNAKLFKEPSKDSEVLIEIPNGTTVPVRFMQYDLRWIGWVYTEYDGIEGWTLFFDDEGALNEYESGEYELIDTEKGEATLVEQQSDIPQESEEKEEPVVINDKTEIVEQKNLVSTTIIYVGIAIIIALTATVIILLINRKK